MKLPFTIASSVAALVFFSGAMADQTPRRIAADTGDTPTGDTIVQIAAVTQEIAHFASITEIVSSPTADAAAPVTSMPAVPIIFKGTTAAAKTVATKRAANQKLAASSAEITGGNARRQRLASADTKPMLVRAVGKSETGSAAWYGGRYVGRRTTSGERLDSIHPTAAHRTLPLNSLARVTNLDNGRSVIVRVTDRGPVSESLLIDMSPRAADQLAMKDAGIVPVKVEQVVAVPPDAK